MHIIGYRKKVATENLLRAYPNLNKSELNNLLRENYRNLIDIFFESIKGFTISESELLERYKFSNTELVNSLDPTKSVICTLGHIGNWEWGALLSPLAFKNHQMIGIYKPIKNKGLERLFKKERAKFGMQLNPIQDSREVFHHLSTNSNNMAFMIGDQNPSNIKKAIWVDFFNSKTACLHGIEDYSKQSDLPILYLDVQRVKRGYYEVGTNILVSNPKDYTVGGDITQLFMSEIEKSINKNPSAWLWTHKRWKHDYSTQSSNSESPSKGI